MTEDEYRAMQLDRARQLGRLCAVAAIASIEIRGIARQMTEGKYPPSQAQVVGWLVKVADDLERASAPADPKGGGH